MASVRSFARIKARFPSLIQSTANIAVDFALGASVCSVEIIASGSSADYAEWIVVRIDSQDSVEVQRCMELFTVSLTRAGAALL